MIDVLLELISIKKKRKAVPRKVFMNVTPNNVRFRHINLSFEVDISSKLIGYCKNTVGLTTSQCKQINAIKSGALLQHFVTNATQINKVAP
jgi:hypothetical protein